MFVSTRIDDFFLNTCKSNRLNEIHVAVLPAHPYTAAMTPRGRRVPPSYGRTIKRLLEDRRLKVSEAAERAGMTPQQFSNLTNDPDLNPTIGQFQRIADALGVPLAALFDTDVGRPRESSSAPAAPSRDPRIAETLRDLLATALTGALVALGASDESLDEQPSSARAERPKNGPVLPQAHRKVG